MEATKIIRLSEVNQIKKGKYHMFSLRCGILFKKKVIKGEGGLLGTERGGAHYSVQLMYTNKM
jgi:hypothetical protein